MKKLPFFLFFLFIEQIGFCLNGHQLFNASVLQGFEVGIAMFIIARFISWGVQLIKHIFEVPKDE